MLLSEYEQAARETDRFSESEITPVLLGLFGEVGSVMATSKKLHREKGAFIGYRNDVEEELGDTLWYIVAISRRFGLSFTQLFAEAIRGSEYQVEVAANFDPDRPISQVLSAAEVAPLNDVLIRLGKASSDTLELKLENKIQAESLIIRLIKVYMEAVQASKLPFSGILCRNLDKTRGRFITPDPNTLEDFDARYPFDEQLPRTFEIEISQKSNGRSFLRWNGVTIGDPLSDNIADKDGYRFHDVFHFANAAILHWSPTFRSLIKHKRKSNPEIDESQDSGRAIVIDEGLSAYVFSYAKEMEFFKDQDSVSFDLLKTIRNFVKGYEVEACPLKLWESAILQGYAVFRDVLRHNGGIVVGNRKDRTIKYKAQAGGAL